MLNRKLPGIEENHRFPVMVRKITLLCNEHHKQSPFTTHNEAQKIQRVNTLPYNNIQENYINIKKNKGNLIR